MNTHNFDIKKFRKEIELFKRTTAPSDTQWNYLNGKKNEVRKEILDQSKQSGQSIERCMLTAICGTLKTKQQQAEFASRLILLDLLME
jgi:hypothetical protein